MADINVQTVLPEPVYNALAAVAKQTKRPLKAVVREAIEEYVRRNIPLEEDPLMQLIGIGDLPAGNWSERKDWRA